MRRRSDDFPAFGNPASAASTTSFKRRTISTSSPGSPVSAKRGVCRVGVAKRAFPRPPCPPRAATKRASGVGEVGDEPTLRVEDLRSDGNADLDRFSVRPVLSAARAVAAFACAENLHATERREVTKRAVREHDDVAATASVAAVGPAPWHVLLSPKAEPAVSALSGFDVERRPVVEHGDQPRVSRRDAGATAKLDFG